MLPVIKNRIEQLRPGAQITHNSDATACGLGAFAVLAGVTLDGVFRRYRGRRWNYGNGSGVLTAGRGAKKERNHSKTNKAPNAQRSHHDGGVLQ
jgi:hypothetical protein